MRKENAYKRDEGDNKRQPSIIPKERVKRPLFAYGIIFLLVFAPHNGIPEVEKEGDIVFFWNLRLFRQKPQPSVAAQRQLLP